MSNKFRKAWRNMNLVEKPGASTHSAKWDRCVEHVKQSGSADSAYAVCTEMLGDESFKSIASEADFVSKMDEYMRKLGISGAGPVPNSLMARQDLEGRVEDVVTEERMNEPFRVLANDSLLHGGLKNQKSMKKSTDAQNFAVWYYDRYGAQKCAVFQTLIDAEAYKKLVSVFGAKDAVIKKSEVDETKKDLIDASEKAEDVDTPKEKNALVDRIKNIQIERQKATIRAREKSGEATDKSFKQGWSDATK